MTYEKLSVLPAPRSTTIESLRYSKRLTDDPSTNSSLRAALKWSRLQGLLLRQRRQHLRQPLLEAVTAALRQRQPTKAQRKRNPKRKATRTLALVCSIKQFVVNVIVETVLNLTSLETF
jgi:hypothetical protein